MRSWCGVVGLLALCATANGQETAPVVSGTFTLLTYNVAGLPQGISGSSPRANTPQISPLLNGYDLVVVQEDFTYHAELAGGVRHPHRSPPMVGARTFVGDGLHRFSRSPFADYTRETWRVCHGRLGSGSDCLASKGFSVARHRLADGVEVDVYNLHMDAGGGAGDCAARAEQALQLLAFLERYSAGRAVVVAGDTNLHARRPEDAWVLEHLLDCAGLTDSGRALEDAESIDRVLVRSSADVALSATSWRFADEFVDADGRDLSDHLAVAVQLNWERRRNEMETNGDSR